MFSIDVYRLTSQAFGTECQLTLPGSEMDSPLYSAVRRGAFMPDTASDMFFVPCLHNELKPRPYNDKDSPF